MFWQILDLLSLTKENGTFYQNLTTESKGHWDSASEHQLKPNSRERHYPTRTEETEQGRKGDETCSSVSSPSGMGVLASCQQPSHRQTPIPASISTTTEKQSRTPCLGVSQGKPDVRGMHTQACPFKVMTECYNSSCFWNKIKLHFCKNWEIPYFHS